MSKSYSGEEIVAVNDLYHSLLWEQRQGREVTERMISDRICEMLAGEKMERTEFSVSMKLSQIQGLRKGMDLDALKSMTVINTFADIDGEELMALIGSYEYVFKCMEEESAGIKCHGREAV